MFSNRVYRKGCCNHVLAKAPIGESGTRTVSTDLRPAPRENSPIVLRTSNLGDDTRRRNGQNFHAAILVVLLAARKCRSACKFSQPIKIEAGSALGIQGSRRNRAGPRERRALGLHLRGRRRPGFHRLHLTYGGWLSDPSYRRPDCGRTAGGSKSPGLEPGLTVAYI